jgi:hypothetical protein
MRVLRKILYISLLFLAAVLAIAFFLPSTYSVNKTIEVNAEPDVVYMNVSRLELWKNWNELLKNAQISGSKAVDTSGSMEIQWREGQSMSGTIRILDKKKSTFVRTEIQLDQPAKMISSELWTFELTGNGTLVNLNSNGSLRYPIGRLLGSYIRERVSAQINISLNQLKDLAENESVKP